MPLWTLPTAFAGPSVDHTAVLQSDLRLRVEAPPSAPWYSGSEAPGDIAMNQNLWKNKILAKAGDFRGVVDVDLVFTGFPNATTLEDLTARETLDPFRFDVHALYIEGRDVLIDNLDLRVGQQLVQFGVGDQFNPTNTFNPNDLYDPLLFGRQASNLMVRLDYTAFSDWTLTGVLVPVFRPALIPPTGPAALSAVDRYPFLNDELRWRTASEAAAAEEVFGYPTVVSGVDLDLPEPNVENVQWGARLGGLVLGQDVGVSYYRGFWDFPVPVATHTVQAPGEQCTAGPYVPETCIDGLLQSATTLEFPRIQVVGFNLAGEAFLGYRMEVAAIFPERKEIRVTNGDIVFIPGFAEQPAGEYDYGFDDPDARPAVLDAQPFAKWVLGLDYTIGRRLYANAQWVHGMLDEMGGAGDWRSGGYATRAAGVDSSLVDTNLCALNQDGETCAFEIRRRRLGDYIVLGTDVRFLSNRALIRLFGIWDVTGVREERWDAEAGKRLTTVHGPLTEEGQAGVLYPEIAYNFGNGLEIGGGALFNMGPPHSKFGSAEAGGSLAFARVRYSFSGTRAEGG